MLDEVMKYVEGVRSGEVSPEEGQERLLEMTTQAVEAKEAALPELVMAQLKKELEWVEGLPKPAAALTALERAVMGVKEAVILLAYQHRLAFEYHRLGLDQGKEAVGELLAKMTGLE